MYISRSISLYVSPQLELVVSVQYNTPQISHQSVQLYLFTRAVNFKFTLSFNSSSTCSICTNKLLPPLALPPNITTPLPLTTPPTYTMYITPEKELYTIIQQFYSGKYADIAALDLDTEFDFTNILYDIEAQFYKIRAHLALADYNSATAALSTLMHNISTNAEKNLIDAQTAELLHNDTKVLNSFIDFKKLNTIDHDLLESIDNSTPSLAYIYKRIILHEATAAGAETLSSPELDLEAYVFSLFSSASSSGKDVDTNKVADLKRHYSDVLILDFAAAWLGLSGATSSTGANDDSNITAKNSYYFFEELTSSSNTDSAKNVINLLAAHLKLCNLPEALECLEKLKTETDIKPEWEYSLLINKIALASTTMNSEERAQLIQEIKQKFPTSSYVKDLEEKSQLFDTIVQEYN